jgi:hypothetical protein
MTGVTWACRFNDRREGDAVSHNDPRSRANGLQVSEDVPVLDLGDKKGFDVGSLNYGAGNGI